MEQVLIIFLLVSLAKIIGIIIALIFARYLLRSL